MITLYITPCTKGFMYSFPYNKKLIEALKNVYPCPKAYYKDEKFKFWYSPADEINLIGVLSEVEKLEYVDVFLSQQAKDVLKAQTDREINANSERTKANEFVMKWLHEEFIPNSPVKPYDHQITGIDYLSRKNKALLGDKQGLGKTLTALITAKGLIEYYKCNKEYLTVIVLCPAFLKTNWHKEARLIGLDIKVYSYEKQPTEAQITSKYILIADEIHLKVENDKSSRTQNYYSLAKNARHLYNLTATPMSNGLAINFYPALKAMDVDIAVNKSQYMKMFCDVNYKAGKTSPKGNTNKDLFALKISPYILQRTKEECLDLPPKQVISEKIDPGVISTKHKKKCQDFLEHIKDEYYRRIEEGEISNEGEHLVLFTQLRQHSSLYKTEYTINMVKNLLAVNESVCIFTEFRDTAQIIADYFGVPAVLSGLSPKRRDEINDKFQKGENKVFVGTIGSAGVGLTLTAACYSIIHDFPWKPASLSQVEDRIHRIGQEKKVTIYHLYAQSIDYVIASIIGRKSTDIDYIVKKYNIYGRSENESRGDFMLNLAKKMLNI